LTRSPAEAVRSAIEHSEFLAAVASIRADGGRDFALDPEHVRPLTSREVVALNQQHNIAEDWSRIRVTDPFVPDRIHHCTFYGDVLLGRFTRRLAIAPGVELHTGVCYSTLANCVIGDESVVYETKLLANYVVGRDCVVFGNGTIVCDGHTTFGNGGELLLGIETGGREVAAFAEIDVQLAGLLSRAAERKQHLQAYKAAVTEYAGRAKLTRGIFARGVIVRNTSEVCNVFAGPAARIVNALLVANSTLLSSPDEPAEITSGACVTNSLLQWGTRVSTGAIVEQSVLTEHSHVEQHGVVTSSILGPNTSIGKGEVTSCLVGPFVNLHHQALLIATLWPEGKGNVSYGANAGSNHTSKAPDQEFWAGEGTFLGLGVNVKFPTNLSRAPHSILASGIITLPQKMTFPFSLINTPSAPQPGISPAYNEIFPAWLLSDNLYAIKRNEGKYRARNKARRTQFEFRVFRPDIVDLMLDARDRLKAVQNVKQVYTDQDIDGLGKNYLVEGNRKKAIEAYDFFIRIYALLALKRKVEDLGNGQSSSLLSAASEEMSWEHARKILTAEFALNDVGEGLRQLVPMLTKVAQAVESSKAKDDDRGRRIIDDYAEIHTPAARDPFVIQTWEEARKLEKETNELLRLQQIVMG
jgi:hypothetical protein